MLHDLHPSCCGYFLIRCPGGVGSTGLNQKHWALQHQRTEVLAQRSAQGPHAGLWDLERLLFILQW